MQTKSRFVNLIVLLFVSGGLLTVLATGLRPCAWLDTILKRSGCLCTLFEADDPVASVEFAPDGDYLAVSLIDGTVRLWRVADKRQLLSPNAPGTGEWGKHSYDLVFSPDGSLLAMGLPDGAIHVWRLNRDGQGLRIQALSTLMDGPNESSAISSLGFSPDGQTLLAGRLDGSVYLWHVKESALIESWQAHKQAVMAVAFAPNNGGFASASLDGTAKLWRWSKSGSEATLLQSVQRSSILTGVAFSPDGSLLAIGRELWDVEEWLLRREMAPARDGMGDVVFSPDGELLAVGNAWYELLWWRTADGALLRTIRGHTDSVNSVAFSPDGAVLASGSLDGSVRLWDVSSIGR